MKVENGRILNKDIYERLVRLETQTVELSKQVDNVARICDKIEDKVHDMDKCIVTNTVKIAFIVSIIMAAATSLMNTYI